MPTPADVSAGPSVTKFVLPLAGPATATARIAAKPPERRCWHGRFSHQAPSPSPKESQKHSPGQTAKERSALIAELPSRFMTPTSPPNMRSQPARSITRKPIPPKTILGLLTGFYGLKQRMRSHGWSIRNCLTRGRKQGVFQRNLF